MSAAQTTLPPVLAGPILRRAEPKRLALWLALSVEADVKIQFFEQDNILAEFSPSSQDINIHQLKCGKKLHILLIDLSFNDALPRDCWIDYTLCVKTQDSEIWQDITEISPDLLYPTHNKLGFLLPSKVGSILHGSCRKPHHDSGDGLVAADSLLGKLLENNTDKDENLPAWPSALIMSGDQIYADDVAGPMLRAIHSVIDQLDLPAETFEGLSVPPIETSDELYQHRSSYYDRTAILPQVEANRDLLDILFGGVRKPVFTTDTAHNHLMTLHENLLMYLMVWSPVLWRVAQMDCPAGLSVENQKLFADEKKILDRFVEGLPQVRRLMAHLPVAMIFDDHDVTDDWNLNRQWEEAVYNHPFSKRMIGNSLSAYFICQGWGNNPDKFDTRFIKDLHTALDAPGDEDHINFIDHLLKFEGWEYQWKTEPPLIVIDTRTRRWRSESSMVKPSGLLDWEAVGDLQEQLYGKDSVLLVSPAPIYGVKLIETIQRIFTWFGKPLLVDAENWMAHPGTANSILNVFMHTKTPHTFVILSGDVHYSFVYDVELRGRKGGPDIWQVTSSGFKNEFPKKLLDVLDIINRWLYSPRSPLNWFTKRKRMRIIPRKPEGHADGRRLLDAAGVGLVELDKDGRPCRFRQLLADGQFVGFDRMENHSRWQ
ncbi:alkaline phosphatase family protein [Terasakiella sp.]|uniref:alkaline phosphatase family protein n=1 Tax=Terasakiella sp. TaxID=2034861 RepID=UPI003AA8178C